MQQEIKAIVDAPGASESLRSAPPAEQVRPSLPESAKWHMRHRPYRDNGGGDADGEKDKPSD